MARCLLLACTERHLTGTGAPAPTASLTLSSDHVADTLIIGGLEVSLRPFLWPNASAPDMSALGAEMRRLWRGAVCCIGRVSPRERSLECTSAC